MSENERIAELVAEDARLREALRKEATSLEVEATYWVPGSHVAGRNPYAHQMFRALRNSASRLRTAANTDASTAAIIREGNKDGDYTPV